MFDTVTYCLLDRTMRYDHYLPYSDLMTKHPEWERVMDLYSPGFYPVEGLSTYLDNVIAMAGNYAMGK